MHASTVLILLGLVAIAALAVRWTQIVLSIFGLVLVGSGFYLWLRHESLATDLSTGDLRGLAPHLGTIAYVAMGLGVALIVGAFLIGRSRVLRGVVMTVGLLALIGIGYAEYMVGYTVRLFLAKGIIRTVGDKDRTYSGDNRANLKALYTAMMLQHDSEDAFPPADKWMDALKSRITTGDMQPSEAMKKFIDPSLAGRPKSFGYAMNDAVAGKYKGDVPDPDKTLLLFMSSDTSWNAHGEPKRLLPEPPRDENLGITVSGDLVRIAADGSLEVVEKATP
jgi:hypothetical protein